MVQSLREGSGAQLCQNIGIGDYIVAIDGHTHTHTHAHTHTHIHTTRTHTHTAHVISENKL